MKRLLFILLITLLTQASCENATSTNKEVETSNPEKMDSPDTLEVEPVVDSIGSDTTQIIEKVSEQKDTSASVEKKKRKTEDNSINIEDALDVNKYKSVRDDPDYIGTPCEYVNSKCIRHNHKNNEEQPNNLEDDL